MKIIWKVGINEYVLCAGPERGIGNHFGPDNWDRNMSRSVQERPQLDADYIKTSDRKNVKNEYRFSITVQLASVSAAIAYVNRYPQSIPGEGVLIMIDESSGARVEDRLLDATMESIHPLEDGVAVTISYFIIGGEVQLIS